MESKKTSFWITYRDSDSSPTDSDTYGKWVCTFTARSVRMLWRNTSYPKASTRMQTRDSAVFT